MKILKRKPVSEKFYFDKKTERDIVKFQNYKRINKKKEIFTDKIEPVLSKLIQNVIYTYKFNQLRRV